MTSELFAATYARGHATQAVSGQSWLDAMLEVEAALARACAQEGLIGEEAAQAVVEACAGAVDGGLDLEAIAARAGDHATPVIPLVEELRARVGARHAAAVHLGATSQDIIDTAAMLVMRNAVVSLCDDARAAARASAQLAARHGDTLMVGRTLLQPALPITVAQKARVWEGTITQATDALVTLAAQAAAVQMGGPVGGRPPAVGARVAQLLKLTDPGAPWHTNRVRVAQIACAVGVLAGALAKVAGDVVLLAQGEVREAREGGAPGRGRSSAMAHKHNPVAAVSTLACARRVPGLVATVLSNMEQEHERAAGSWQAEWGTLSELVSLTGSAAAWAADMLSNLELDTERMRVNVTHLIGGADVNGGEQT